MNLQRLIQYKVEQINYLIKDYIQEITVDGNDIVIFDNTNSFTTISCNEKGYHIHWGSRTPGFLKTLIEKGMKK